MKQRPLGRTGAVVSELCLGTLNFGWNVNQEQAFGLLDAFRGAGGSFIQTTSICFAAGRGLASSHASEDYTGRWWRARSVPREELFLATRIVLDASRPLSGASLEQTVRACCEASLRRLQTTYIDLLILEWGGARITVDEVLGGLSRLKQAGLVRHLGAGALPAWRVMEAIHRSVLRRTDRFDVVQADFSLLAHERAEEELLELCREYHLAFLARSPLGGGVLTQTTADEPAGWRARRHPEAGSFTAARVREALSAIARRHEATPSQIALAWVLGQRDVTAPVVGLNTVPQLLDLIAATELTLDADDLAHLARAVSPPRLAPPPAPALPRFTPEPQTLIHT